MPLAARAFSILVHFFAVPCKTTTLNDKIRSFAEKVKTPDGQFSFLYSNLKARSINSTPGQSSHIRQTKKIGTTGK